MIKPELEPYCMTINGRKTINFIGQNYTVSSINIYGGKDSDFILQSDKLSWQHGAVFGPDAYN